MNPDDFEKRLERLSIRPIPGEWRQEILQTANAARPSGNHAPSPSLKTQNPKLKTFLTELLWPCPQAWAGLAAVWLVILTLNFAMREPRSEMAQETVATLQSVATMMEQRRLYLELADLHPKETAEPPKPGAPRPRSDRRTEYQFA